MRVSQLCSVIPQGVSGDPSDYAKKGLPKKYQEGSYWLKKTG